MNESIRTVIRKLSMGQICSRQLFRNPEPTPIRTTSRVREKGESIPNRNRAMALSALLWSGALILFASLALTACGENGQFGYEGSENLTATMSESAVVRNDIGALSPLSPDCSGSGLPNSAEEIYMQDTWIFQSNCFIESYACGNVGYLIDDSRLRDELQLSNHGIVELYIVGRYKTYDDSRYCMQVGRWSCEYATESAVRFSWTCDYLGE